LVALLSSIWDHAALAKLPCTRADSERIMTWNGLPF
jgi:hypothetical protein